MHLGACDLVCRDKKDCGLGVKNLKLMNIALHAKLTWRILSHPYTLWAKILWKKYGLPIELKTWNSYTSHIWKLILLGATAIRQAGFFTNANVMNNQVT